MRTQRRMTVKALFVAMAGLGIAAAAGPAWSQAKEVKVALIAPLSGPWARQGELMQKGADMAIEDINRGGGIKSMGGAKMRLVVIDAGDSVEKAKNAAQRMVSQETDIVGATGSWLSSFTLAVTEVTERAELPVLTLSFSDLITERGHKYVFQTSPTAGAQAQGALPALVELGKLATGKSLKTAGIVMDNTASPVSFSKPMREGGLQNMNLKLIVDEIYTPPLPDATALVQKVRNTRPEFLLLLTTNVPDSKLMLEKLSEMGLGSGRLPVISNGAQMTAPELLKVVGKGLMEGVMSIVANHGSKGQEKIIAEFKKRKGEPWMGQDSISTYGDMWIFKEALEKARVADRKKVAEAIRAMDTTTGPARYFPGERLKFEPNGRRAGAGPVIVQWQNGEPKVVYPPNAATVKAVWSKK